MMLGFCLYLYGTTQDEEDDYLYLLQKSKLDESFLDQETFFLPPDDSSFFKPNDNIPLKLYDSWEENEATQSRSIRRFDYTLLDDENF
eukprot:CAMPEP_0202964844 /NCGR_PEP_ID=MMETSP1396-20130829/8951_1 /ASSEMBLY_ACC=CAM_ASM_000872 /TAXON_ID= /ORGANISM="Pseudokeronopsis sp., Strain Brazil" /LENGTH=87 /DNA_ID=CAMNT_0049687275 /DNA_START=259 /DNA_END=522 /DNA_ORIENTATION=-